MHIKGTAVKSINEFVKSKFTEKYDEWLNSLPEQSSKIYKSPVFVTEWYLISDSCIEPIAAIGRMFYDGDVEKAAYDTGVYSAKSALSGIYKIFLKVSSPDFIIKRAGIIMNSYYKPGKIVASKMSSKSSVLQLSEMKNYNIILEKRILGWMVQALLMSGAKNVTIDIPKSIAKGDELTDFIINWD